MSALLLIGVYVSIIDVNAHASTEHEVAVEFVVEYDESKAELIVDDYLQNSLQSHYLVIKNTPTSKIDFIDFYLEKDIFRPPLAA